MCFGMAASRCLSSHADKCNIISGLKRRKMHVEVANYLIWPCCLCLCSNWSSKCSTLERRTTLEQRTTLLWAGISFDLVHIYQRTRLVYFYILRVKFYLKT